MKLFKRFAVILVVLLALILASGKLFPQKTFLTETYLMDFSGVSLPAPTDGISTEKTTFEKLIQNGAVLSDSLMLVNEEYPLPEDYSPDIIEYKSVLMNPFTGKAYIELKNAVKENFDNSLYIMSAFRTCEEQLEIIESGNEFASSVSSCEHLTGLAIDVYVKYHAGMGFIDTEEGQFVNKNCKDYGFIIRYPHYGENITNIPYEPWHLRYVGLPHSEIIAENRLTFEEYILSFVPGKIYIYNDYFILRNSTGNEFYIHENSYDIKISSDNTGFNMITGKYR